MKKYILIIILLCFQNAVSAQIKMPVKWSYAAKKVSKNVAVLFLKAELITGWHIYSVNQKEGGPERTILNFLPSKDYTLIGKIQEPKPIKKHEEVFDMDVFYFEKSVVFTQKIKLNKSETLIKGKISFMACTDEQCLPPDEVSFSIPIK